MKNPVATINPLVVHTTSLCLDMMCSKTFQHSQAEDILMMQKSVQTLIFNRCIDDGYFLDNLTCVSMALSHKVITMLLNQLFNPTIPNPDKIMRDLQTVLIVISTRSKATSSESQLNKAELMKNDKQLNITNSNLNKGNSRHLD
ncbi:hypothetical protein [Alishewanella sp. HL-SH06]|uniref:hypothetical protein n=1 Tax=Alishewanella sp. HL-SH06 TaxID=3461144 RepID=UPI004042EAD0